MKALIRLIDTATAQDEETGDRCVVVKSMRRVAAEQDIIGLKTLEFATSQNILLSTAFKIIRMLYHGEKWLYANGKLYEIKFTGKGKQENELQLNVCESGNADIKNLVESLI